MSSINLPKSGILTCSSVLLALFSLLGSVLCPDPVKISKTHDFNSFLTSSSLSTSTQTITLQSKLFKKLEPARLTTLPLKPRSDSARLKLIEPGHFLSTYRMNQLKSNDINKIYHPNLSEQLQYLLQKFSTLVLDPTTNKVKNKEITDYKHRNNSEKKLYEGYVQNSPEAKDDESWYSWMMASFVGKRQKNDLENTEHAKKDSKIKLRATRFLDNKSNFYNLSKKIFYYRNKFPIRLKFLSKPQVYSLAKIRFERFNSYFSYCEKIFKQKFLGYERSVEQELGQSPIESGIKTISNYLFYTKRSLEESSIDSLAKFDQARKSSQSNIEITQNQLSRYKLISIRNYDLKTKKVPFISGYEHSTVVRGDGNCQFRAISLLIYGTQDYHEDVRRNVIKILRAEKDFYKEFVQERTGNEIGQAGDPFEAYVTLMSRVGEWGDQLTLKASSKAFNLEIVVLELSEGRLFLTEYLNENKNSRMPLPFGGIFFSRDHYEVLIKT